MNSEKVKDYLILIGLGGYFLVCIIILFVYLSGYLGLNFLRKEISLGEILNALTALCIAILVPFIIEKRFTRNKTLSESMYVRLNNLQNELESFISDIESKCIASDITQTENNKLIINLKLRKIGLNINGFRNEFPKTYQKLLIAFAKFRKITTLLEVQNFSFGSVFYKDSYLRYIDFDKSIEDVKLGTVDIL